MITMSELVKGRDKEAPEEFTRAVQQNLKVLLEKMNIIRAAYGKSMIISSGWRTQKGNASTPGAAKGSRHLLGLACDVQDTTGDLWNWCLANLKLLNDLGMALEDRRYSPTWVHFQIQKPPSLKMIFIPSTKPAPAPHLWDGKYDSKFDGIEKD